VLNFRPYRILFDDGKQMVSGRSFYQYKHIFMISGKKAVLVSKKSLKYREETFEEYKG